MKQKNTWILVGIIVLLLLPVLAFAGGQKEAEVVKIAFIGPLTGPNAAQGMGAKNSFDLAIREANRSGKFPFTFEMLALDDASDPATGANAATKAVSDPAVVAASGHWNSPVARATIPIFHENGIPLMIWGAIGTDLTDEYGLKFPEITRNCPKLDAENEYLAETLMDLGYKTVYIIHDTSSYGVDCMTFMKAGIEKRGGTVVAVDGVNVGEKDFMPLLTRVKEKNPDVLYYGGIVTEAALLRVQMVKAGLTNMVYAGISGLADEKFNEVAGKAAEGTLIIKPGDPEEVEGWPEFVAAYDAENFSEPMGAYGQYSYDAANIIIAAIAQVGTDPADLIPAIRNIKYEGLLGVYEFDKTGQTTLLSMTRLVSQDGVWVKWEDSAYTSGAKSLPAAK
ncbi:MAG: branched-chain amino acid ABC transporter substrate-binding protein [Spirochaetales bacterium]|nr:branched-chain amino acid ABC transporter substrate-binding protein [Spirochaetales bacterium]